MKIGHLHSVKQQNMWVDYPAIMIRIHYSEWKSEPNNWIDCWYGENTGRALERGLIYNYKKYYEMFQYANNYDTIFLSLNFDVYHNDFHKFVTDVIQTILHFINYPKVKLIIGAGNETYEKRRDWQAVKQTIWDTKQGVRNSTYPEIPVCFWNEKIYTTGEKNALDKLLNDNIIQTCCTHFGFQSLGTSKTNLDKYIKKARNCGFIPIDIEFMSENNDISYLMDIFNFEKSLGINQIYVGCIYISEELARCSKQWRNYAFCIGDNKKDKFKVIEEMLKYNILEDKMGIRNEYKLDDRNDKVIDWIQAQLYYQGYLQKPINYGYYDQATEIAVKEWQTINEVEVTGKITKYHISVMIEQYIDSETKELNPDKAFRQLIIYSS